MKRKKPTLPAAAITSEMVGRQVLLLVPHPWAGHTGTVKSCGPVGMLGGRPGLSVALQNGTNAGVTGPREFQVIG